MKTSIRKTIQAAFDSGAIWHHMKYSQTANNALTLWRKRGGDAVSRKEGRALEIYFPETIKAKQRELDIIGKVKVECEGRTVEISKLTARAIGLIGD